MKKLVAIFLLAVLIPSLLLAWLAVRSLRDQELVVQSQTALLHQNTTDALAADMNLFMDDIRLYFRGEVDELIREMGPEALARDFDRVIRSRWAQAEVGAVVSPTAELISPDQASMEPRVQFFNRSNEAFLTSKDVAELYPAAPAQANTIAVDLEESLSDAASAGVKNLRSLGKKQAPSSSFRAKEKVSVLNEKLMSRIPEKKQQAALQQEMQAPVAQKARAIQPYSQIDNAQIAEEVLELNANPWSNLRTWTGAFQELIEEEEEGAFSRFLQNQLHVLLWYRPGNGGGRIFCAQLDLGMIKEELGKIVSEYGSRSKAGVCLALLEETGSPVALNVTGFVTDWKKPFVASEIGEILPHWEVAAYLLRPGELGKTARLFRFTLGLLVFVLIAAIGFGSLLIVRDVGRQMKLARQKTDFVSNVSHELKTPLTSIRMFSDLLSDGTTASAEKRGEYAGIISSEAARLTRLINNLLDFSRMERGEKKYNFEEVDVASLVREIAENYRPHLEAQGIALQMDGERAERAVVKADPDALSQVMLNLISNAEKYGDKGREIRVEAEPVNGNVEVRVLDRGAGIGKKDRSRIFNKFYRVDDSLSSGIQGSGLGLTLARQIAMAHGGDVIYRDRDGGGSCFVVVLPILKQADNGRAQS